MFYLAGERGSLQKDTQTHTCWTDHLFVVNDKFRLSLGQSTEARQSKTGRTGYCYDFESHWGNVLTRVRHRLLTSRGIPQVYSTKAYDMMPMG